jgi:hypothetical protein
VAGHVKEYGVEDLACEWLESAGRSASYETRP